MKEFLKDIFGNYFKPFLTLILVILIFAFIFSIMWTNLTEATQRFGDIILGVLLAKIGTVVDYWLGTTDRDDGPKNKNKDEDN